MKAILETVCQKRICSALALDISGVAKKNIPARDPKQWEGAKGDETSGGDDDDDDTEMRAQRSRHMRAHESRHIRAHIWQHTEEIRQMRAHR